MQEHQAPADVIIVDDTPANLQLLTHLLKAKGHSVRPAPNGRLALRAAESRPPDLVLLDISMPEMDGYEVCRQLKESPKLKDIPVIFISALTEPFDKVQAFHSGGVDYITKPFHVEEVLARVGTHVALFRLRRELDARARELEVSYGQLRASEELREALTHALVHDLKTPLSALLGNTRYLIRGAESSPETREVLDEMLLVSEQMYRMVLDVLDVARRTDVALTPRRVRTGIAALLDQACAAGRIQARLTQRVIHVEGERDREVFVDPDLVARIIENLLDNAVKYAPKQSEIRVDARRLGAAGLALRISDLGSGIPSEYRERIFLPGARLDRDVNNHARSSRGLGLAFCRMAALAHGGRIWVEDNAPIGTAFCVELPAPTEPIPATAP